jgi:hypothetical protein
MAMNMENLCVTVYVLSFDGRHEVRAREAGLLTIRAAVQGDLDRHDRTFVFWPEALDIDEDRTDQDHHAFPDDSSWSDLTTNLTRSMKQENNSTHTRVIKTDCSPRLPSMTCSCIRSIPT